MHIDPTSHQISRNHSAASSGREYKVPSKKPETNSIDEHYSRRPQPPASESPADKTELSKESKERNPIGSAARIGALLVGLGDAFSG